jgi:hypothetical protein
MKKTYNLQLKSTRSSAIPTGEGSRRTMIRPRTECRIAPDNLRRRHKTVELVLLPQLC